MLYYIMYAHIYTYMYFNCYLYVVPKVRKALRPSNEMSLQIDLYNNDPRDESHHCPSWEVD